MGSKSGVDLALVRPARMEDLAAVEALVAQAQGDQEDMHLVQFLVAQVDGQVVGCGRIKPYAHVRELASIAVAPRYRGRGIGAAVVQALMARAAPPLYLMCIDQNVPFFARLGFRELPLSDLPSDLRPKSARCFSWPWRAHLMRWG